MRRIFSLAMCSLFALHAMADETKDARNNIRIQPLSVTTTYEEIPSAGIQQGMTFRMLVEAGKGMALDVRRDASSSSNSVDFIFVDSTGHDLASKSKLSYSNSSDDPQTMFVTVMLNDLPAPDSQWISIKGYLPVKLLENRIASTPVAFHLEKDTEFSVDGMTIKVKKVSGNNVTLIMSADREFPHLEIEFTDLKGDKIEARRNSSTRSLIEGKTSMTSTYDLRDAYKQVKLTLHYWGKTENREWPIDVKFPFGPPACEKE